jgi:hypothetical protein
MKLTDLMVDSKSAWVEFSGCPGFEVEVANLSRKELVALRKRCVSTKFDRKTRQPEEVLDEDKFVREFTEATIKNWKGFKLKYLEELLLVDLKNNDPEDELPYDQEQAQVLIQNSTEFDTWVNEVVFDLDNFRARPDRGNVGKTGKVAEE